MSSQFIQTICKVLKWTKGRRTAMQHMFSGKYRGTISDLLRHLGASPRWDGGRWQEGPHLKSESKNLCLEGGSFCVLKLMSGLPAECSETQPVEWMNICRMVSSTFSVQARTLWPWWWDSLPVGEQKHDVSLQPCS